MNVLIIEDESPAAEQLIQFLNDIDPEIDIVGVCDSIKTATKWFTQNPPPDLAFMDIQLADGLSFRIFDKIQVPCPVIFATVYDQYAIKAFSYNSIDYLLKPIDKEKVAGSLKRFHQKSTAFKQSEYDSKIKSLIQSYTKKPAYKQRVLAKRHDALLSIKTEEINWFYFTARTTWAYTTSGERYQVGTSLDQLEQELDPHMFRRANRQFILSINCIIKVEKYFNYTLLVITEPEAPEEIIVSRKNVSTFKKWLGDE